MKASDLRCGLFATRMSIADAMEYFAEVTENDPFALTGLMVMLNTIADTLDREGLEAPRKMIINPNGLHNAHVITLANHQRQMDFGF